MSNKKTTTNFDVSKIKSWSDEEWEAFRQDKWNFQRNRYASEKPGDWFMMSKSNYIEFLEKHGRIKAIK